MYNCLCGLNQLHKMGIIHRNLKPSNIFIDENCQIKFSDFGQARSTFKLKKVGRCMSPHVTSRQYRSPEISLGETYDESSDIFSLGCVFYEMMHCVRSKLRFKDP